ncbi:MAG: M28 family peptidase [Bacteroidetes bacterium]|nr:M28 family peptidase [Bacteroidota bacterium]
MKSSPFSTFGLSAGLFLSLSITACSTLAPSAQQTPSELDQLYPYTETITVDMLEGHLYELADDKYMGRDTGTEGERMAAAYLISQYEAMGLPPVNDEMGYLQPFTLNANVINSRHFHVYPSTLGEEESHDMSRATHITKIEPQSVEGAGFSMVYGGAENASGDVVFAGFGVQDSELGFAQLDGEDLEGKWVMIFNDIPYEVDGEPLVNTSYTSNIRYGNILSQRGAAGILLISDQETAAFESEVEESAELLDKPRNLRLAYRDTENFTGFPQVIASVRSDVAEQILGRPVAELREEILADMAGFTPSATGQSMMYMIDREDVEVTSNNVMAFLEGSDPELKDEVVVITSHYDHIGISLPDSTGDRINNGADDDGSGTVAVLSAASAFAKAAGEGVRPRRSILFMHVSGEEKGLLGSRYYSDHPVLPVENHVANINADMIGRSDQAHLSQGVTDYFYLIGGPIISSGLDSLVTVANEKTANLLIDYAYNDLDDPNQFYRRSDHWNFGRLGIPFSFFFTGVHEDYHQPSDEADKINYPKLTAITQVLFGSANELANIDERPVVDNQAFIERTQQMPRN